MRDEQFLFLHTLIVQVRLGRVNHGPDSFQPLPMVILHVRVKLIEHGIEHHFVHGKIAFGLDLAHEQSVLEYPLLEVGLFVNLPIVVLFFWHGYHLNPSPNANELFFRFRTSSTDLT